MFYVALTRTERALFVSGHHWGDTGAEPKGPSEFLQELHELVTARSELGTIERVGAGTGTRARRTP